MTQKGVELLKLMFNPGETICVSPNKYSYHSIPLEMACSETATLVPPNPACEIREVPTELLTLVALNPIKGFRLDANCYRYRNFLLELDEGNIKSQIEYVRRIGVPYSAMIFSGGKSVHTLISLEKDLPSEDVYRHFSQWLLSILTLADQNTKNPSRSIRIPGGLRDGDPARPQRLLEMRGKVALKDLAAFLSRYDHLRPKERKPRPGPSPKPLSGLIPGWVTRQLHEGIDFRHGRNRSWFKLACALAKSGFSEESAVELLGQYFKPEHDFRESEWKSAIASAFKYVHKSD